MQSGSSSSLSVMVSSAHLWLVALPLLPSNRCWIMRKMRHPHLSLKLERSDDTHSGIIRGCLLAETFPLFHFYSHETFIGRIGLCRRFMSSQPSELICSLVADEGRSIKVRLT